MGFAGLHSITSKIIYIKSMIKLVYYFYYIALCGVFPWYENLKLAHILYNIMVSRNW